MSSIGVVLEPQAESRVAATPETVKAIRALGYQVLIEKGAGAKASFPDSAYVAAGAKVATTAAAWKADIVLKVNAPTPTEIKRLKKGAILVGILSPALNPNLLKDPYQRERHRVPRHLSQRQPHRDRQLKS